MLPYVLENIEPHVDEIVIVDGGPAGPSTDNTKQEALKCDKVVYKSGTFKTMDGAWDSALQKNTAISNATGNVFLFVSADMFFDNLKLLREAIDSGTRHSLFFCSTLEFWLDTTKLRLYSPAENPLALPSNILEVVAVDKSLNPYFEEGNVLHVDNADLNQRLQIPQAFKFHLGWIRPFGEQVVKHIRHVKQHAWGEEGEKLLKGGERGLEQWAMLHVLSYQQIPYIEYTGKLPLEMQGLRGMKYNDGYDDAISGFEKKYGISVFRLRKSIGGQ